MLKYLLLLSTVIIASPMDDYHLSEAYKSYESKEYNRTKSHLLLIKTPSLESQITLADTYYKEGKFQKAIDIYQSIFSTSSNIKQQLYYNMANAYAKLGEYDSAKEYYAKTLQLGEDKDAEYNLKIVALLAEKKEQELGMAHPKSQNSASSKSDNQNSKESKNDKSQSASGSSGNGKNRKAKKREEGRVLSQKKEEQHPFSSKVYELINEGYIYEKQPW